MPLFQAVGDRASERVTRFNLTMTYVSVGDWGKAEEELQLVVAVDEAIGHPDRERDRATLAHVQTLRKKKG